MINNIFKPVQRLVLKLSLLLVFTAIAFSSYQITNAETPSALAVPSTQLCGTFDLKLGMVGSEVLELQKYLNNNGYPVAQTSFGSKGQETTYFGELTKNALAKLQATHNLQATFGVFDSVTKKFLGCTTPTLTLTRNLSIGMVGTDVLALQQFLNNNGFPVALTGPGSKGQETMYFGVLTKNALSQFQKANQIPTESGSPLGTVFNFNSTYTLTYKAGAGGSIIGNTSQAIKAGGSGTPVTANPQRGYYFTKWSDGLTTNPRTDTKVQANQTVTATFARRLTAEGGSRTPVTPTYTITYDANTSTGGTVPADQIKTEDITLAVATNTGALVKSGYIFAGWNTLADGTGTDYATGSDYTDNADLTLFAKWTALIPVTAIGDITGTPTVGTLLTAGAPTPAEATLSYQWQSATTSGGVYTNIPGANSNTYTLVSADLGTFIKVVATGTIAYNGTVTSTATTVVLGDVSFTYNGSPVTYGTVYNPTTGRVWLDRNLGATQVALSSTDAAAYGDLFQWGRPADGHQVRTSGTQSGQVATITPGTNTFIIPSIDWSSIDSDGSLRSAYLAKTDGTGICPVGFRVPTDTELNTERLSWSSNDSAGAFSSPLKLTLAGNRYCGDGSLNNVGAYGVYWSSSVDGAYSRVLYFYSGDADLLGDYRANGLSARCIKD